GPQSGCTKASCDNMGNDEGELNSSRGPGGSLRAGPILADSRWPVPQDDVAVLERSRFRQTQPDLAIHRLEERTALPQDDGSDDELILVDETPLRQPRHD